jgi:phage terminase large subunit-like protein
VSARKVVLHGRMPALEAEMLGMIAGVEYERVWTSGAGEAGKSPDRADAMVWGVSKLMRQRAEDGVRFI